MLMSKNQEKGQQGRYHGGSHFRPPNQDQEADGIFSKHLGEVS